MHAGGSRRGEAVDCLEKGVSEHTGVGTTEGMFDSRGMTSTGFHELGICICR